MKKENKEKDKFQEFCDKFEKALESATEEAQPFIAEAHRQLKKAVEVSEKYGVEMIFSISPLQNTYTPKSMKLKWKEVEKSFSDEEKDDLMYKFGIVETKHQGWQHSGFC